MFVEQIEILLKSKNISKKKFLSDLGLAVRSFSNWRDRGTIPSGKTLQRIADYFDVPVDYLLGNTDEKNPPAMSQGDTVVLHITDFHGQEPEVVEISREKYEKIQKILKIMEDEQDKESNDDSRIF